MTVHWLQPVAFWGLALLALPILVHLLIRQQSRRVPFPSLRFVRGSKLSAVRRRFLNEWLLLAIRAAAIAAAVLALAAPVAISDSRNQEWRERAIRAIVVARANTTPGIADAVTEERQSSVSNAMFTATDVADAVRDATTWLQRQPISSKELVVIGDLRDGDISSSTVESIPRAVGIRFLPDAAEPTQRSHRFAGTVISHPPTLVPLSMWATLEDERTHVSYQTGTAAESAISVRAATADQRMADAALTAMWANAPITDPGDRRIIVIFDGGDDRELQPIQVPADAPWMRDALQRLYGVHGGQSHDRLIVYAGMSANNAAAPAFLARVAGTALAPDLKSLEPRRIPAADLARWSRPPSPELDSTLPVDEGDRRWMWALALVLLVIEYAARRSAPGAHHVVVGNTGADGEQRVA